MNKSLSHYRTLINILSCDILNGYFTEILKHSQQTILAILALDSIIVTEILC